MNEQRDMCAIEKHTIIQLRRYTEYSIFPFYFEIQLIKIDLSAIHIYIK